MERTLGHSGSIALFAFAVLGGCERGEVPQPPPPAEPPSLPTGQIPTGQIPTGQIPTGQIPTGQIPTGQIPTGQIPTGQIPTGQIPTGLQGPAAGFGLTKQMAINVCNPDGERAYLSSLRCPDGASPQFTRLGNVGPRNQGTGNNPLLMMDANAVLPPGVVDEHVIDEYQVTCAGGLQTKVYMDMYHCRDPHPPMPVGFLQVPGGAMPPQPQVGGATAPPANFASPVQPNPH